MYSIDEFLFWCSFKANFPYGGKKCYLRDIAGISSRELSEIECLIAITSVVDGRLPDLQFRVRANLIISGWIIKKTDKGTHIIYITQIDLAEYIPNAWLRYIKMIVRQYPGTAINYLEENDFSPAITKCTAYLKVEDFDHGIEEHSCNVDGIGEIK